MAQLNYTNVLSWHNGKLHTCALGAQWNTTHLCSHGTTLHTKSPISGRLIDDAAIPGANGCGCRHWRLCPHWSRLVCRLRPWKWSVPWRRRWWWWSACHWCPGLPSQVYTGLLVRRRSWVRLLSHRVVWREDCSWLLVTEVIWIARRWRDLFQMSAVPTQVTSWCLYQEWTWSALPHHLSRQLPSLLSIRFDENWVAWT